MKPKQRKKKKLGKQKKANDMGFERGKKSGFGYV